MMMITVWLYTFPWRVFDRQSRYR